MTPILVALLVLSAPSPKPQPGLALIGSSGGAVAVVVKNGVLFSADGVSPATDVLKHKGGIEAVALDGDGTLWVARARGQLGRRGTDGKETWTKIPDAKKTAALAVKDGVIVWRGTQKDGDAFVVSTDGGATFVARPEWPIGSFETVFTLEPGGRIQIIAGWEASCGGGYQERRYGNVADEALATVSWGLDVSVGYLAGAAGWAYVAGDCGEATGICVMNPADDAIAVLPIAIEDRYATSVSAAVDADTTWLAVDRNLHAVKGQNPTPRYGPLPETPGGLAIVGHTPWALVGGKVYQPDGETWRVAAAFDAPAKALRALAPKASQTK